MCFPPRRLNIPTGLMKHQKIEWRNSPNKELYDNQKLALHVNGYCSRANCCCNNVFGKFLRANRSEGAAF